VLSISDASERAASLTRQLLCFSRQTLIQRKVVDLNVIVAETSKMLRRLIGEDIRFVTVLAPSISRIKVDPGQLDQVLMNLAVNSRDAMPRGGKLTIETANVMLSPGYTSTHLDCKSGPHVMLAVTDTGSGMTPDIVSHIFELFFTTKGVGKGTGLGLAMVFGIVQQCGGCIHVYSEPGLGTTFKIYFPAVSDRETHDPVTGAVSGLHGTETILLVEDEDGVRRLAMLTLQKYGYHVLVAADGREALKLISDYSGHIDLVLSDVVMPNISGPEMVEILRDRFTQIKVLFMSGYTDDSVVRHGLLDSQVSFIQKPYTPTRLARKIRDVLDGTNASSS
jgi:CheY-like chemotaxis protein